MEWSNTKKVEDSISITNEFGEAIQLEFNKDWLHIMPLNNTISLNLDETKKLNTFLNENLSYEKIINPLFTEYQVEEFASDYTKKVIDKMNESVWIELYDDIQKYLYEHYTNSSLEIKNKLLNNLTHNIVDDKFQSIKYKELRRKICSENIDILKDYVNQDLVDENNALKEEINRLNDTIRLYRESRY